MDNFSFYPQVSGSLTLAPIDNIFPVIVVITQALTHFLLFFRITVLFDPKNKKINNLKSKIPFVWYQYWCYCWRLTTVILTLTYGVIVY